MSYDWDVDKIVKYLERYKNKLPELYIWNAKIHKLIDLNVLTKTQIRYLNGLSPYNKEIHLKTLVGIKLKGAKENNLELFESLCLWIIKDWGGIGGAKDIETIKSVNAFLNQENPSYNRIASTSKVGSYLNPGKYIIYDSRVAYSLNWILLSENAGQFFFPIPEGRNSRMSAFDLHVLIRLKNISNYRFHALESKTQRLFIKNCDKNVFIPEKSAYIELIKLIKLIHDELWKYDAEKSDKLYFTEMLLFSIADKEVFLEITQKLALIVNNQS